jgi:hypothetical protein
MREEYRISNKEFRMMKLGKIPPPQGWGLYKKVDPAINCGAKNGFGAFEGMEIPGGGGD